MNQAQEQLEAQRKIDEAYHNALPDVYAMPSVFNPSGLVPYPCGHGLDVKPRRYAATKFNPRLNDAGDELPPFGGFSWGRAKYLIRMDPVVIEGKHIQFRPKCVVCEGKTAPYDFNVAADQ